MLPFMFFIFLCFFGILAMLYHMLRTQEKQHRELCDAHAQLRVRLRAMEARLDALGSRGPAEAPESDPLLRLSFDAPVGVRETQAAGDPALDLHFDPMDGVSRQETGTR